MKDFFLHRKCGVIKLEIDFHNIQNFFCAYILKKYILHFFAFYDIL